jgi:putative aldouronate transport system permease protein
MSKSAESNMHISKTSNLILNIILIVTCVACLLPLVLVFAVSITDNTSLTIHGYNLIPKKIDFGAYTFLFKDPTKMLRAYGMTIVVTIIGSILSLLIISAYAFPISRKDFKYRTLFSFVVFFTMLFNGGLVPFYMTYVGFLGLKDSIWAIILPYLMVPLYVLIMRTFFVTSVPDSLIEAAKIDGAGELRIYWQIALPLAKPSLATIALFNVLAYWNDWWLPLLFITDEKKYTLQYLMYNMQQNMQFLVTVPPNGNLSDILAKLPTESVRMAMAIIAIGPIVLAYPFFQRYFVEGLTIGAVKG